MSILQHSLSTLDLIAAKIGGAKTLVIDRVILKQVEVQ